MLISSLAKSVVGKEENVAYLVAAYAVLWAVSFGLVFSIVFRQRKLDSELQALRLIVEDEDRSER